MSRYRKLIAGAVGALLTWGATAHLPDGSIDRAEWWGLAFVVAAAVGIERIPNDPPAGERADPAVSERGITVVEVAAVLVIICAVVWLVSVL